MADEDIGLAVLGVASEGGRMNGKMCTTCERCLGRSLSARRFACESFWGGTSQLVGASILVSFWRCSAVRGGYMGGGLRGGGFEPTVDVGAAPAYMLSTSC